MKVGIKTAYITDKGLNPQYTVNEDSYLILEEDGVFAVADGVGGANAGDLASQTALRTISKLIRDARGERQPKNSSLDFVKTLIDAGNDAIYDLGKERQQQIATTIAVMIIEDDYAIIGHVGDSRIYVFRDAKLIQLTKDHSKLQNLIDNRLITAAEQMEFRERHVITKALGAEPSVEPDIQKVILRNKDIFVLCTDGIYIHNSDEEMIANIEQNKNKLFRICEGFKQNCYEKGAKDNLTAVVLKIEDKAEEAVTKVIKVPKDMTAKR